MKAVQQILKENDPLHQLLENARGQFVGYAFDIDYGELSFLTNDTWKEAVSGIPHNAFLLASALNVEHDRHHELDREVLLLRVLGPTPLPQASDLIKTRIQHHQRRTRAQQLPEGRQAPEEGQDGFDWLTRSELQSSALRCRIIGTFHVEDGQLRLGSDIENYMAMSPLRVYKPCPSALEMIVNHVNPEVRAKAGQEAREAGFAQAPSPITIGTVRYTSTRRLQQRLGRDVQVHISPSDFLARRTAILGMTRTGKSNTVKTTVAAVTLAALADGVKVGQLVFDLNGEYANANHQDDGSSIAEVFPEETVCYRADDTTGFQDLRINFHEDLQGALQLMSGLYAAATTRVSSAQDVQMFFGLDLSPPGDVQDFSARTRWLNHQVVMHLVLDEAGYSGIPARLNVPASRGLVDQVTDAGLMPEPVAQDAAEEAALRRALTAAGRDGRTQMPPALAKVWLRRLRQAHFRLKHGVPSRRRGEYEVEPNNIGLRSSGGSEAWVDKTLEVLLNMLAGENSGGTTFIGARPDRLPALPQPAPHRSTRAGDPAAPQGGQDRDPRPVRGAFEYPAGAGGAYRPPYLRGPDGRSAQRTHPAEHRDVRGGGAQLDRQEGRPRLHLAAPRQGGRQSQDRLRLRHPGAFLGASQHPG